MRSLDAISSLKRVIWIQKAQTQLFNILINGRSLTTIYIKKTQYILKMFLLEYEVI